MPPNGHIAGGMPQQRTIVQQIGAVNEAVWLQIGMFFFFFSPPSI
jgi:hypothetical protein